MRLRDRFNNELAFSRYLQRSSSFRAVVEQELGLRIRKTSAKTLKEIRLYRRPHRLDFPVVSDGLVEYRKPDGSVAWRLSEGHVDYRDPVVRAANDDFLRADLILFSEDFKHRILVENQFGISDLTHRNRLMEYYNSTQCEIKPIRDEWSWVFWIAEEFREQDIEWNREYGHPIAMFRAWPKKNAVGFELIYAPVRTGLDLNFEIEQMKPRLLDEW